MHAHWRCWKSFVCVRPAVSGLASQGGLRVVIEPGQLKPDYCGHHPSGFSQADRQRRAPLDLPESRLKPQIVSWFGLCEYSTPVKKRFTDWTFCPSKASGHQQPPWLASTKLPLWGRHKLQLKKTRWPVALRQALHQHACVCVCAHKGDKILVVFYHIVISQPNYPPQWMPKSTSSVYIGGISALVKSYVKADVCDHSLL